MFERKRSCDFKKCRMRIPIANEIANRRQAFGNRFLRDHFAVHADTFTKRDEVRGCEQAGAIFSCPEDRIDHRANRTFAVRSSNVNDPAVAKLDLKRGDEPLDIFQAELDPEALEAIQPDESLLVGRESRQGRLSDFHSTTEK